MANALTAKELAKERKAYLERRRKEEAKREREYQRQTKGRAHQPPNFRGFLVGSSSRGREDDHREPSDHNIVLLK